MFAKNFGNILKSTFENFPKMEIFEKQCSLVFAIIQTLSHFGDLCLSPDLLPEEYSFLHSSEVIDYAVKEKKIMMIGQLVLCLRIFESSKWTNSFFDKPATPVTGLRFIIFLIEL